MKEYQVALLGPSIERTLGGIATVEHLILENAPPEIQIDHIPTHEDASIFRRMVVFSQALTKLLGKLLRKEVDVAHIMLSQRGSALRAEILTLVVTAFRIPVVIHAQSSEFHIFHSNLSPVAKNFLNWVFRKCSCFISLSESWKKFHTSSIGLSDKQDVVLPNPTVLPPTVPERPASDDGIVQLLYLGRVGQRKGTFDLIEAFAALPESIRNRSRLIIGGDGEVEKARGIVQSLGLNDRIKVPGWIYAEQRDELLTKADVFILPSYNEGLPLAVLEAMGWGLPAITTPVGGIPELINHSQDGILVTPGNIEQLSAAIGSLIEDEKLRLHIGENARERVKPLDIEHCCQTLATIYRDVVEEKHSVSTGSN